MTFGQRGEARTLDVGVLLASLGNRAYTIAVVAYIYDVSHSASLVGLAAALRYLSGLAASALVLPLIKRVLPRRILVATHATCAALLGAAALAVAGNHGAAIVIALACAVRAASAPQPAAAAALLPEVLGERDLAASAGRQNSIDKMALLAGPALGGLLLLVLSPAQELLLVGGFFLLAMITGLGLPPRRRPGRRSRPVWLLPAHPDGAPVSRFPKAVVLFGGFCVMSALMYGSDTVLFEVLSQERYHLGDSGYGLLFAGLGAGGLIGLTVANRLAARRSLALPLVAALWVYALPTSVLVVVHNPGLALGLQVLRGAGALLLDYLAMTVLQRILLPRQVPVVISFVTAGVSAAVAAGALLTPVLLTSVGLNGTLLACGLTFPILGVLVAPALVRTDRALARRADELRPRTTVLERLSLTAGTSRPTLEMLAAGLTEETRGAGDVVVAEGEASEDFYVIVSGEVAVSAFGHREAEQSLATLGPGQWFGEIAALTGIPRSATVRATQPTHLLRIGASDFRSALEQLPPSAGLLGAAASRLRKADPGRELPGYE